MKMYDKDVKQSASQCKLDQLYGLKFNSMNDELYEVKCRDMVLALTLLNKKVQLTHAQENLDMKSFTFVLSVYSLAILS